jgi:hypothetical protein
MGRQPCESLLEVLEMEAVSKAGVFVVVMLTMICETAAAPLCVLDGGLTVLDDGNDLMWYQTAPGTGVNWSTATTASGATFAGYTDWRLPSVAEYQSLGPQLPGLFGAYQVNRDYWSNVSGIVYTLPGGPDGTQNANSSRFYWPVRTEAATTCPATAGCSGLGYATRLTDSSTPSLTVAITGKSIDANAPDGENWKEIHCGTSPGGDLQKVGLGPTDRVDPQRSIGSWSIAPAGDTVSYDYGPGGSYTLRVYQNNTGGICWQRDADDGVVVATGVFTAVSCLP